MGIIIRVFISFTFGHVKFMKLYVHVYYFHVNVFAQIHMYIENTGKTALCRKIMNNLYLDHINIPVMKICLQCLNIIFINLHVILLSYNFNVFKKVTSISVYYLLILVIKFNATGKNCHIFNIHVSGCMCIRTVCVCQAHMSQSSIYKKT